MAYVSVIFAKGGKEYVYVTDLSLIQGAVYNICADNITTYSSPVKVVRISDARPISAQGIKLRKITEAKILTAPARKDSRVERIIFNREKNTSVVCWKDGMKTILKKDSSDEWDEEKAIALHYMKKCFEGRGYFNEIIKELRERAERV